MLPEGFEQYATEQEARKALAEILGNVSAGTYVQPSALTVEQACADWIRSRHRIKPTTAAGYEYVLQPVRTELGGVPVQKLTRRDIDDLIRQLQEGGLLRSDGTPRRPWSARSCNYMVGALRQVLEQLVAEGALARNVALMVDRVSGKAKRFETFTAEQVQIVLDTVANDRNRHAWHMALAGMRRGEIAGQRWEDVDLDRKVIRIGRTRVDIRGQAVDQADPKSESSARPSPFPTGCCQNSRPPRRDKQPRNFRAVTIRRPGLRRLQRSRRALPPVDADQDVGRRRP